MTRAIITQMLNALVYANTGDQRADVIGPAITAAREHLATELSRERAELIAGIKHELSEFAHNKTLETLLLDSLDMLEADAQQVSNLLARIHRDGGHYESKHGRSKAINTADLIVAKLNAMDDAQQAKRVPMTAAERSSAWIAATIEMPSHENCYLRGMFDAEAHHGITQADKPTGWDNGLSQDYCAEFGQWLASRPGARQQIKEMFERDTW